MTVGREVSFDVAVYTLEAVKRAAYALGARLTCDISLDGSRIRCVVLPIAAVSANELEQLVADFNAEVLDQDLRTAIARETEAVRNAILAHALSGTGLQK